MTAVLTRDQADLLARYGTWQVSWMLTNPETGIPEVRSGASCGATGTWCWDTTPAGIVGNRDGQLPRSHPANIAVTWAQLRAAAKAVPDGLLADLAAARRRTQRERLRAWQPFVPWMPRGLAPWVQPDPQWQRDAEAAERAALLAVLDALVVGPDGVPGQLDLFQVPA